MIQRRTFLKTAALGAGVCVSRAAALPAEASPGYFGVHPFIDRRPEAVFIMRTHVGEKTDTDAMRKAGEMFARSVMVPFDASGVPVSRRIAIKPNITGGGGNSLETMGIITDPYFVEGVVDGMKPLGFTASQFSVREVNCKSWDGHVYGKMAAEAGVDFRAMNGRVSGIPKEKMPRWTQNDAVISENDLVWRDIPEGVVHRRLPYLWPINAPDSWLLNIAKFKTHSMGLTLCCKNFQGAVANGYQNFCAEPDNVRIFPPEHVNPQFDRMIAENLKRHIADGIPRWSCEGSGEQELWAARTLDSLSTTTFGLHVVEGIYGRDGHFGIGPNPHGNEDSPDGKAWDYMTNLLLFGKDPFRVDIIGHWLGGHEPGNFGFFHIARERGLSTALNPMNIPVYLWEDNAALLKPLASFDRAMLRTNYLQKTGAAAKEPLWHMCDEPFDYSSVEEKRPPVPVKPGIDVLTPVSPTSSHPSIALEYRLAEHGPARVELIDDKGTTRRVLVNAIKDSGWHMVSWDTTGFQPGPYAVRFLSNGFSDVREIVLKQE